MLLQLVPKLSIDPYVLCLCEINYSVFKPQYIILPPLEVKSLPLLSSEKCLFVIFILPYNKNTCCFGPH